MTSDDFRTLALGLPGAIENSHMGHPDFRVNGKIFATLHYPDEHWGMVKLSPEQQHTYVQLDPDTFVPVKGAWGRQGATAVRLRTARTSMLEEALRLAWTTTAAAVAKAKVSGRKRQASAPNAGL